MKTFGVIIILISFKLAWLNASKCSSIERCKCIHITDGILADCSNLGLLNSPSFMKNVISANLSFNVLTSLPEEGLLPAGLKFLDLSSNKITNLSHDGLPPFTTLKTLLILNLSNNYISLDSKTYFKGVV